ncbi:MAG: hypothetical protein ACKO96_29075 [Flammeovirgaceae bacterium]
MQIIDNQFVERVFAVTAKISKFFDKNLVMGLYYKSRPDYPIGWIHALGITQKAFGSV